MQKENTQNTMNKQKKNKIKRNKIIYNRYKETE